MGVGGGGTGGDGGGGGRGGGEEVGLEVGGGGWGEEGGERGGGRGRGGGERGGEGKTGRAGMPQAETRRMTHGEWVRPKRRGRGRWKGCDRWRSHWRFNAAAEDRTKGIWTVEKGRKERGHESDEGTAATVGPLVSCDSVSLSSPYSQPITNIPSIQHSLSARVVCLPVHQHKPRWPHPSLHSCTLANTPRNTVSPHIRRRACDVRGTRPLILTSDATPCINTCPHSPSLSLRSSPRRAAMSCRASQTPHEIAASHHHRRHHPSP